MQRAEVINIPRVSGSERTGRRIWRNLIRHEESRISRYAGPVRHRIVVSPHNVVTRLNFRQRVRIKLRTRWLSCVWIDVDEPLKRHVASSLPIVPGMLKHQSSPQRSALRGEKWRKDPPCSVGELLDSVASPNLGLDSSRVRRPMIQLRLRPGGGDDESRFQEQINRRLTPDLLWRQWKSDANYQNSYPVSLLPEVQQKIAHIASDLC